MQTVSVFVALFMFLMTIVHLATRKPRTRFTDYAKFYNRISK